MLDCCRESSHCRIDAEVRDADEADREVDRTLLGLVYSDDVYRDDFAPRAGGLSGKELVGPTGIWYSLPWGQWKLMTTAGCSQVAQHCG